MGVGLTAALSACRAPHGQEPRVDIGSWSLEDIEAELDRNGEVLADAGIMVAMAEGADATQKAEGLQDGGGGDDGTPDVDEMGEADTEGHEGLRERLANARHPDGTRVFGPLVAVSVMVFFALCSQCMGTLATIRRETRSWRWPVFTFTYMTVLAWIAAVAVFQIGRALGFG